VTVTVAIWCLQGCDASVLIDDPKGQGEKNAVPNQTLHNLEIIDQAKAAVEKLCKKKVSCADTVAFAAAQSLASVSSHERLTRTRLGTLTLFVR
jgi:hypothetical protein